MKNILLILLSTSLILSCNKKNSKQKVEKQENNEIKKGLTPLAQDVVNEARSTWEAYKRYAWGHDVLKPLTKSYQDWYKKPLYISPIDAYSTLYIMGLKKEAKEIENYVVDSLDFNKNIDSKIFEVNIRILGGILSMYERSKNPSVLLKAKDFADRMMHAFKTKTGIPKYWVNLSTGKAKGDTVNVAEAASYTFEMGLLSYYTKEPKYYQAAKKATLAIHKRRSKLGLIGSIINVETGEWVSKESYISAGVDSYYEYLYKSYLLFGDEELGKIWRESIKSINQYIPETYDNKLWYGRVDMDTGKHVSSIITLYDAFFPAILALSGDKERAVKLQHTWDWLWDKYGLEPMIYDYKKGTPNYPVYDLNPEIIESAYYLYNITGDMRYYNMNKKYWEYIKKYCKTKVGFTSIKNVETMEKKDYMPTFFFAETLKYLYLTFSNEYTDIKFKSYIFSTEAHPFKRSDFDKSQAKVRLGIR